MSQPSILAAIAEMKSQIATLERLLSTVEMPAPSKDAAAPHESDADSSTSSQKRRGRPPRSDAEVARWAALSPEEKAAEKAAKKEAAAAKKEAAAAKKVAAAAKKEAAAAKKEAAAAKKAAKEAKA
jgi:colicin import membrane protein